MIRTLESQPVPVTAPQPSLPSSSEENIALPLPQLAQPSPPVETPEDPLGGSASPTTQPGPEAEAESSEPAAFSGESDVVTANIVNMNGRPMCRVCGMQVRLRRSAANKVFNIYIFTLQISLSRPVDHFQRKHADLL